MSAPRAGFLDALAAVSAALRDLDGPSMIIGGVAVIAHGVPRLTVDIDATVAASAVSPAAALAILAPHGIGPRVDRADVFAAAHQVLLATHAASGTDVDLSFAWLPFETEALASRQRVDWAGVTVAVARPEDLVIYKMVASRPLDLDDVEALLALHGGAIDLGRVRRIVTELAAALDDDERPRRLEALIRQAGLS